MSQTEKTLAQYVVIRSLERLPQTFKQLLESCHSLFPDQLLTLLYEMETNHLIRRDGEEYTLDSSFPNRWLKIHADWNENLDRAHTALSAIMGRIYLPHCLDYEWWFTYGGCEKVIELLLHNNPLPAPGTVVFLESPLFGMFASFLLPESQIYILDKSGATLEAVKEDINSKRVHLVQYDAEEPLSQHLIGIADMIFFDPPWYVDYYNLFLHRSMQLAFGRYATVAFVLFPFLTRPTSLEERKQVFEIAMSYGLSLVSMEMRVAHYYTPQFEQESLTSKGIEAKNWRRGDLAIFISDGTRLPENIALRVEEGQWQEIVVGKIKVKMRIKDEDQNVYIPPELLNFTDGNVVIPTVSRRDPIRSEIDLWTSTQRGFKIKGSKAVWKIVEGIRDNLSLEEIFESVRQGYPNVENPESEKPAIERVWHKLRPYFGG